MLCAIIFVEVFFNKEFNNCFCEAQRILVNIAVIEKNDGKNVMDFYIQKKVDNRGKKIAKSNYWFTPSAARTPKSRITVKTNYFWSRQLTSPQSMSKIKYQMKRNRDKLKPWYQAYDDMNDRVPTLIKCMEKACIVHLTQTHPSGISKEMLSVLWWYYFLAN